MEDMSLYNESFEAWKARTDGTRAEWSRLCAALWAEIKAQQHYHAGRGCREVKCELYPNG
jgi:hypothetical protein